MFSHSQRNKYLDIFLILFSLPYFSETLKLEHPYVELILCELKYLNIVEHGELVTLKMFQVFERATENYQQVIIRAIPDIIDMSRHDEAMETLM